MKTSTYYDLDKAMIAWFNQQRAAGIPAAAGIPVSGIMCTAKAKYFHDELKIEGDFNASSGLLTWFKNRYGIWQIAIQGEKLSSDDQAAQNLLKSFRALLKQNSSYPSRSITLMKQGSIGNVYQIKPWLRKLKKMPLDTKCKNRI